VRWLVIVVAAALVGLLAYGVSKQSADTTIDAALANGERIEAPERKLAKLGEAGTGGLSDYRGKVVVLNFWASWCDPCVDELPLLERTHRRIERDNGLVLGVNYKDLSTKALGFKQKFGLTFPVLRDPEGRYAEDYASRAFPETFVIDRKGRVAAKRRGPVDQAWLDETLPPLLAES
jgi:cytochrome c biogenesis protein CcmG, thiol:disulfide interchange protein DsbE